MPCEDLRDSCGDERENVADCLPDFNARLVDSVLMV